tara:strand:- start:940 stop:1191 length:252 start_codon:yes stop_codon:yes gene_type:complete
MSQVIKLSKKELASVTETQTKINNLIFNLGQYEVQKTNILTKLEEVTAEQNKLAKELTEKHGEGKIDLEKGELTLTESIEPAK